MKPFPRLTLALVVFLHAALFAASTRAATVSLPRATPESQGVSSTGVLAFIEAADRLEGLHSFMLVRHGKVVTEGWWAPYAAGSNHELYSLSKSFTSTAVGLAVGEGLMSLDDEVWKVFPEDVPADPSANLKAMRIRDLITMTAGHQDESPTAPDKISAKAFLSQPVPHKPGTHFKYNTPATFMLSAILQKKTGMTVLDYLKPRLFEPLGIAHPVWNTNFQGIDLGGYGLRVTTEDIAKFGQLYLQKGRWQGRQLLPAGWVESASARQVSNGSNPSSDWEQGYGFQFWRSRHGAFRGDGAFGQYCIVVPDQDVVIAITSGLGDMQAVLNLVWNHLLPAFSPKPVRVDPVAQAALKRKVQELSLPTASGSPGSAWAARVAGKTYRFPVNDQKLESVTFGPRPASGALPVTLRRAGGEVRFEAGYRRWIPIPAVAETIAWQSYLEEPAAASFAWSTDDTLVIRRCLVETPYVTTWKLRFEGEGVDWTSEANVSFGRAQAVPIKGRAE